MGTARWHTMVAIVSFGLLFVVGVYADTRRRQNEEAEQARAAYAEAVVAWALANCVEQATASWNLQRGHHFTVTGGHLRFRRGWARFATLPAVKVCRGHNI